MFQGSYGLVTTNIERYAPSQGIKNRNSDGDKHPIAVQERYDVGLGPQSREI
jgi:hypothetical protein